MSEELKNIHTACINCYWARYENNTQIGCDLDLLSIYKQNDIDILEAENDEKEFFIINGVRCLAKTELPSTKKEIYEKYLLQYHAIINKIDSLEDIEITLQSLYTSTCRPQHITVIVPINSELSIQILNLLKNKYNEISWRVQNMVADTPELKAIDIAVESRKDKYYVIVKSGLSIPPTLIYNMSVAFIERRLQVFAVLPDSINFTLMNWRIHEILQGNSFRPLVDKLQHEDLNLFITTASNIWQKFQA